MGLYHIVDIAYGFEIPTTVGIEDIEEALKDQPSRPDSVGFIVVGDLDTNVLATRCTLAAENTVTAITPAYFTPPELTAWTAALHDAAVRIGCPDHPEPTWLVIHNYR